MKKRFLIIGSVALLLLFIGLPTSSKKEYNLHISDFNDLRFCENVICEGTSCAKTSQQIQQDIEDRNNLIKVNYLDLNYNEALEKLSIETAIDTTTDKTANFFHLVLTDGNLDIGTKNCEASVGHLYVDFTDEANPKVNVFTFNGHLNLFCNNGETHLRKNVTHNGYDDSLPYGDKVGPYINKASLKESFYSRSAPLHREEVYSSLLNPTALKFSIDDTGSAKVIKLELDVADINDYQVHPLLLNNKSYSYEGIKFGERVGVWFWAAANAVPTYTENYISNLLTSKTDCSTCVHPELETKSKVLCGSSSVTSNPVEVGKSTTLSFEVINYDYFDTDKAPVIINYTGLPAGAKPSVPVGQEITFAANGSNGKAVINIEWTPTEAQIGDHQIAADFLVEYGLNNLHTECAGVRVTVKPVVPECKLADLKAITQADQDMAHLNLIASQLEKQIKRVRKLIGQSGKVDNFDPAAHNSIGWKSYNAIIGSGIYLFQCTNVEACAGSLQVTSLGSEVTTFRTAIENLKSIALSRANKLRKALVQLYLQEGLSLSEAKQRASRIVKKQYLQGVNNQGINPTFISATSFVDLHVNTYGLSRFSAASLDLLEESCGLKVVK